MELGNEYYTTVKNYGTGLAPYFMALGWWVGGLVAGFVFTPLNSRLILSGGNPVMVAFANFMPMAVFAIIQATYGLRVTEAEEDAGLDIVEHGMYGYPEQFIPASELVGSGLPGSPTHASSVLSTATPVSSQA